MSVILSLVPSGTLIEEIQNAAVADAGLTIAASGTATITQAQMDTLTEKSVRRMNHQLGMTMGIAGGDITPSRPVDAVLDLITLQVECLISKWQSERAATGQDRGVRMVKLEGIQIEFDPVDRLKNLDAKYGFCAELDEALKQYRVQRVHIEGASAVWDGTEKRWVEVDHSSTSEEHRHYNPLDDGDQYEGLDPGDY